MPEASTTNAKGFEKSSYEGLPSTLCGGCGHDSITRHIIKSYFELAVNPHFVAKMSGIGCSSKTPTYFLNDAHGFNAVHGRMPSVATGTKVANKSLNVIGVSGDGDTASIGMGQFVHLVRRNAQCVYVIENNGVYGLTKGQFSATADMGSVLKKGEVNELPEIDTCALAIQLGGNYVARSFSGNAKQCVPLIKGAIVHKGTAMLDIISPCITFNNHEGSTKSFKASKEHEFALQEIGFYPNFEVPNVELDAGEVKSVEMPDGSVITLKQVDKDYDPTNRIAALSAIHKAKEEGHYLTGLLYVNVKDNVELTDQLELSEKPLTTVNETEARMPKEDFEKLQKSLS